MFNQSIISIVRAVTSSNFVTTVTNFYETTVAPNMPAFIPDDFVKTTIGKIAKGIGSMFTNILSQLGSFLINAILIIPLMFGIYFKKMDNLLKRLKKLIPHKYRTVTINAFKQIGSQLYTYVDAKAFQSLILGIICCVGFFVAGVPGWLMLGLFSGFFNIVPYIGPYIGAAPAILLGLMISPTAALIALITVIVAQLIDNFYLSTFFLSDKVNVDPLLTAVLILAGARLLGAMGMIFIIPLYLVYRIVLVQAYLALTKIYDPKALKK
jgi:predicted PurR-regulated permease PerM